MLEEFHLEAFNSGKPFSRYPEGCAIQGRGYPCSSKGFHELPQLTRKEDT